MIRLIRKKGFLKILEIRYANDLTEDKKFDLMKIYSFKKIKDSSGENRETCTMQINLKESEKNLWGKMKKKYRKHIRSEELKNIKISNSNRFEDFYKKLYLPLCNKQRLKPYPLSYLMQGELWISTKEEKLLSGSIIFSDEDYATQSFTASNHIEYNGNRLLIWTIIKYYKNKGLKYFNFGGGESDYKRRFGSEKFNVYVHTRYLSKRAKILNTFRNTFKKINLFILRNNLSCLFF